MQELVTQGDEASGGRSVGWENMQEILGKGGVVTHIGNSLRTCQCKEQDREGWSMEELRRLLISSLSISKPLNHLLCTGRSPRKLQTALHSCHFLCTKMQ